MPRYVSLTVWPGEGLHRLIFIALIAASLPGLLQKQGSNPLHRHRPGKEKPLGIVAAHLLQDLDLILPLHALGQDLFAQVMPACSLAAGQMNDPLNRIAGLF